MSSFFRNIFRSSKTGQSPGEQTAENAKVCSGIQTKELSTAQKSTSTALVYRMDDNKLKLDLETHFKDIALKDAELDTLKAEVISIKAKNSEFQKKIDEQEVKMQRMSEANLELRRKLTSSNKKIEMMRPAMEVARGLRNIAERAANLQTEFSTTPSETDTRAADDESSSDE